MVSATTILRRRNATAAAPAWLAGPDRDTTGLGACLRCAAYVPLTATSCPARACTVVYCGRCRRRLTSWGPVGCRCDLVAGVGGHGTVGEARRRPVPVKGRRPGWWDLAGARASALLWRDL